MFERLVRQATIDNSEPDLMLAARRIQPWPYFGFNDPGLLRSESRTKSRTGKGKVDWQVGMCYRCDIMFFQHLF